MTSSESLGSHPDIEDFTFRQLRCFPFKSFWGKKTEPDGKLAIKIPLKQYLENQNMDNRDQVQKNALAGL